MMMKLPQIPRMHAERRRAMTSESTMETNAPFACPRVVSVPAEAFNQATLLLEEMMAVVDLLSEVSDNVEELCPGTMKVACISVWDKARTVRELLSAPGVRPNSKTSLRQSSPDGDHHG